MNSGIQGPSSLKRRKEHRLVFNMIRDSDLTIQVLDARFPHRCRSIAIEEISIKLKKPLINCISKTDLIPPNFAILWKKFLSNFNPTIHISSKERMGTKILRKAVFRNSPFVATPEKPLTICIVGYPNVGKSSLINVLSGRHSAPVSPKAGFTRSLRRVKISPKLYLIDTPGVSPLDALPLAEKVYLGTISAEELTDPDLVVDYIIQQAKKFSQKNALEEYLKSSIDLPIEIVLENVARQRGLLAKGNEPQLIEAARIIIRDFTKGKIRYFEDPRLLIKVQEKNNNLP